MEIQWKYLFSMTIPPIDRVEDSGVIFISIKTMQRYRPSSNIEIKQVGLDDSSRLLGWSVNSPRKLSTRNTGVAHSH